MTKVPDLDKNRKIIISIIIPIFNSQDYLEACLDSILVQDCSSIEIILINDGSTDNSAGICNKYSNKYSFIKAIHKRNEGVSIARNVGIMKAVGEYIFFIDSDDWIKSDAIENLISIILKTKSDLIINKYCVVTKQKKYIENFLIRGKHIDQQGVDKVLDYLRQSRINIISVWQYIFKREIVLNNDIFFNSSQNGVEDVVFTPTLFTHCSSFHFSNKLTYYYRRVETSASNNYQKDDFMNKICSNFYSLLKILKTVDSNSKRRYIYFSIYKNIFFLFHFFKAYSSPQKDEIRKFLEDNKAIIKKAAKYSGLVHFYLFCLLGSFYGMLLSYNLAKLKGRVYKLVFRI